MKAMNPRLTQKESAKELGYSSATVKLYRKDIDMPSPYRIQSNANKRKQKFPNDISNNKHEPKVNLSEPEKAKNDLTKPETDTKSSKRNKNILKGGSIQENIEIDKQFLEEILDNNDK